MYLHMNVTLIWEEEMMNMCFFNNNEGVKYKREALW